MIKLPHRQVVELTPLFLDHLKQFYNEKSFRLRQPKAKELLQYYTTPGGIEMIRTQLFRLPFEKMDIVQSRGDVYFKATTREIVTDIAVDSRRIQTSRRKYKWEDTTAPFNIGAYSIYLGYQDMLVGRSANIHLIPERNKFFDPETNKHHGYSSHHCRHMHHYAIVEGDANPKNPLSYKTKTCWGGFGSVIPMLVSDGDMVELLRLLYKFLFDHNPHSPLIRMDYLPHYERIEDEN